MHWGAVIKLLSSYYCIFNHKNFIPEYLENALTDFVQTSRALNKYWKKGPLWVIVEKKTQGAEKYGCK